MKLNELIIEKEYIELSNAILEAKGSGDNSIVKKWAGCLDMSYDDLHKVWDKAEKKAGKGKYGLIVHIFKRMLTSVKGITKKNLKACGKGKFNNYKIQTKQSMDQLLSDK